MDWKPLKKSEIDFEGKSYDQILDDTIRTIKKVSKENGTNFTGKQLRKMGKKAVIDLKKDEIWVNDLYQVNVDSYTYDHWIHLSIKRRDKKQINSSFKWQHFQWIKNQLCGDDFEGLELFPSEKRLVNTANQYHLWVLKDKQMIPVGWKDGRVTYNKSDHGAKQTLETK